jgi:hypothetical protein
MYDEPLTGLLFAFFCVIQKERTFDAVCSGAGDAGQIWGLSRRPGGSLH